MVEPAKQKTMVVQFQRDATGGNGTPKKKAVLVGPGLPADSTPSLKAPAPVPTIATSAHDPYGGIKAERRAQQARGNRGGPAPVVASTRGGHSGGGRPSPGGPQPTYTEPEPEPESNVKMCKALFDFEAENPDELSFNAGDMITFVEDLGEWWRGEINGNSGIFPASYVELQKSAPRAGPPRGRGGPPPASRGGPAPRGNPVPPSRGAPASRGAPPPASRGAPPPARGAPASRGAPPPSSRGAPPMNRGPPPSSAPPSSDEPGVSRGPPKGLARGGPPQLGALLSGGGPMRGRGGPPPQY